MVLHTVHLCAQTFNSTEYFGQSHGRAEVGFVSHNAVQGHANGQGLAERYAGSYLSANRVPGNLVPSPPLGHYV